MTVSSSSSVHLALKKVKVTAAEKEKAEKEKKDRMWKELLEQKRRERRERKVGKQMEKQMEKQLEKEVKECEKQSEQCRKVWKMSVAAEEDGWTSVKGKRMRRSEESSVLSEEEFPSFEKEKKEKEMKEKLRKECFEKKRRERLAREEKKREKMEKKLEEEKKELERQRVQKKQEKVQLRREKEDSGSERRIAAGFKRGRKQSSEEREVEQIMSDNLLEPEKEKRPQRKCKKVDTFTDVSTYLFTIFLSHNTGLSHISKS